MHKDGVKGEVQTRPAPCSLQQKRLGRSGRLRGLCLQDGSRQKVGWLAGGLLPRWCVLAKCVPYKLICKGLVPSLPFPVPTPTLPLSMHRVWRTPASFTRHTFQTRGIADSRPFEAGDLVLLRQKTDRAAPPILSRPLQPGRRIETHKGVIKHDDILGKRVRDVVSSTTTKGGSEFRLHEVSLDDYVRLSKRLVTPIYPGDANLIVSLLDLHPTSFLSGPLEERLEILEAGTGQGSLTLHLSRAIHVANECKSSQEEEVDLDSDSWKSRRRAILHTTDVSPKFAAHAEAVVRGFKRGMYARNIDFHVGDVSTTVKRMRDSRGSEPFLSHAFLDLPAADGHLTTVATALRVDGTLIVFNPSITQITACAAKIKDEHIPLDLEKVVELGTNGGSSGREWTVQFVRPRRNDKTETQDIAVSQETEEGGNDVNMDSHLAPSTNEGKWSLVCRPRVGERITGGGFLGVWKKQRDMRVGELFHNSRSWERAAPPRST